MLSGNFVAGCSVKADIVLRLLEGFLAAIRSPSRSGSYIKFIRKLSAVSYKLSAKSRQSGQYLLNPSYLSTLQPDLDTVRMRG
jgi:hypothetical protein